MFELIQNLYSSFSISALSLVVMSALIAGTVAQLIRDGERSWRAKYNTAKPALMAIYLRVTATLMGGLSGLSGHYAFLEIPAPLDPATLQPLAYAGPSMVLSIFLGLLGGLFFTLVIAGLKQHLKKNPSTKNIADSLPSFEDTIGMPIIPDKEGNMLTEEEIEISSEKIKEAVETDAEIKPT